jgi:hypothetical protein
MSKFGYVREVVLISVLLASTSAHAQLASLVMGGLQALPQVMSNIANKVMFDSEKCDRDHAQQLSSIADAKRQSQPDNVVAMLENVTQASYSNCLAKADKAKNGSIIDAQVVTTAVTGAIGYQGMMAQVNAGTAVAAASGSNAAGLQSVGMNAAMASSGASASALALGGANPLSVLPGLGLPGVMPGITGSQGASIPVIPGINGTIEQAGVSLIGQVIGNFFSNANKKAEATSEFKPQNLLTVLDVPVDTGRRDDIRSSFAAQGALPKAAKAGYENIGDTFTFAKGSKSPIPFATLLSIGYEADSGSVAMAVYDISTADKGTVQVISESLTKQYGKPAVEQKDGIARANWIVESGTIFIASEGKNTTLGWKNADRLDRMVADINDITARIAKAAPAKLAGK